MTQRTPDQCACAPDWQLPGTLDPSWCARCLRPIAKPTKEQRFSDEAVYLMCSYLDRDRTCKRCPRTFDDPQYGLCWNGCYGLAEETLTVAREAMTHV